ncbi:MAG: hypothetical protein V1929_01665 [bacterium]
MNKTPSKLPLATMLALAWTTTFVQAQMKAGPQMPPAGSGASQILTVPTSPSAPTAPRGKQPPVGMTPQPEDLMRDPFWPIGYMPPKAQVDVGPAIPSAPEIPDLPSRNWEQAQKALSIKGIIKSGSSYVASINNQILGENEKVSIYYDSQKYVWRITAITAKTVQFQPDPGEGEAPKSE